MRAARIHAWNQAPTVDDIPSPPLQAGHTRVRLMAAGVGHLDRSVWTGEFMVNPGLPYIPGVEGSGVVLESDTLQAGAAVWMKGGGLGVKRSGTWCEEIVVPDAMLSPLPEGLSMALAACFFTPCTTAWVALHELGGLKEGERVLVTGASGAVGSIAVQLALEAGAQVQAIVASQAQAALLPAGAVPVVIDRETPVFQADVKADLLIDGVGGPVLEAALRQVVPGGRAVLLGYAGSTRLNIDLMEFLQRDVSLLPLNMMRRDAQGRAHVPEILARLADGRLQLDVATFPLAAAPEALDWLVKPGHRGRAVLLPQE